MDPKALSGLDPKLRETYERVMGAQPVAPAPQTDSVPQNPPAPAASPVNPPLSNPVAPQQPADDFAMPTMNLEEQAETPAAPPQPFTPAAAPVQPTDYPQPQNPVTPVFSTGAFGNSPAVDPQAAAAAFQPLTSPSSVAGTEPTEHASSPILKISYIVGAIIFFILYAIFWMKVFNVSLPF